MNFLYTLFNNKYFLNICFVFTFGLFIRILSNENVLNLLVYYISLEIFNPIKPCNISSFILKILSAIWEDISKHCLNTTLKLNGLEYEPCYVNDHTSKLNNNVRHYTMFSGSRVNNSITPSRNRGYIYTTPNNRPIMSNVNIGRSISSPCTSVNDTMSNISSSSQTKLSLSEVLDYQKRVQAWYNKTGINSGNHMRAKAAEYKVPYLENRCVIGMYDIDVIVKKGN